MSKPENLGDEGCRVVTSKPVLECGNLLFSNNLFNLFPNLSLVVWIICQKEEYPEKDSLHCCISSCKEGVDRVDDVPISKIVSGQRVSRFFFLCFFLGHQHCISKVSNCLSVKGLHMF